jgi:chemotaxis protein MotB
MDRIPVLGALVFRTTLPRFCAKPVLSTSRATELVKLFVYRYQFAPSRLSAAGYAEFHPVAENTSADGRARNRRVDIVILNPTNSELMPPPLSSPQATSSSSISAPKSASSRKMPSGP